MAIDGFSSSGSSDSGYESGIVEVFDNELTCPLLSSQEYAKQIDRQRQNMLAGELSRLDADEYQQDILDHMICIDVSDLYCRQAVLELTHSFRRLKPYQMSTQLIFRPRSNGS